MMSACSLVLSSSPTTLPARSIGRTASTIFALLPPAVGSMNGSSVVMLVSFANINMSLPARHSGQGSGIQPGSRREKCASRSCFVLSMHRAARLIPTMAHCSDRSHPARDDEMQALGIFHRLDHRIVVVGIEPHCPRALGSPVAPALEIALWAHGEFGQPLYHIGAAHAGVGAKLCVLRAHRDHHVGSKPHVP